MTKNCKKNCLKNLKPTINIALSLSDIENDTHRTLLPFCAKHLTDSFKVMRAWQQLLCLLKPYCRSSVVSHCSKTRDKTLSDSLDRQHDNVIPRYMSRLDASQKVVTFEHLLWRWCLPDIPVSTHHNRFLSEPSMLTNNRLFWGPPTFEETQQTFSLTLLLVSTLTTRRCAAK